MDFSDFIIDLAGFFAVGVVIACLWQLIRRKLKDTEKKKAKKDVEGWIEALKDKNCAIRWEAACALGEIKDAKAVEPLIESLKDENSNVRISTAYALGEIRDTRAVEPLIEALKDEDNYVREAARAALEKIKAKKS